MKTRLCVLVAGMSLLAASAFAQVNLQFGKGDDKVSFWNTTVASDVEELDPAGPMAFRVLNEEFWVADSLAGRLLLLDKAGKQKAEVAVHEPGDNRIEDFALITGPKGELTGLLVLCREPAEVLLVAPDGSSKKKLCDGFIQAQTIESAPGGTGFAVADFGKQAMFLYSAAGVLVREVKWEWSGLCFDPAGNICYLRWDEPAKINHLVIETLDGKPVRKTALAVGEHMNPRLWHVSADGECVLTFIPPEGFTGFLGLVRCDPTGKVVKNEKVTPPVVMNRFLEKNPAGDWFLAEADYNRAPDGVLRIAPFSF
jgi:hypothetical protein